jgi:hypothetical protein
MSEWLLSRRDDAIVAWHEVPGNMCAILSRPVGYGLILAGVQGVLTESSFGLTWAASLRITCARSYRTLRDGSF